MTTELVTALVITRLDLQRRTRRITSTVEAGTVTAGIEHRAPFALSGPQDHVTNAPIDLHCVSKQEAQLSQTDRGLLHAKSLKITQGHSK